MKTPLFLLATGALCALSSCSSVKATAAKMKESTSRTLAAAKEKTLGPSEPKLRLTKADPSRFLPEGTSSQKLLAKATKEKPRLLAKNTPSTKKISSKKNTSFKKKPVARALAQEELPPLELPPLPAHSEGGNQDSRGILPSMDGSDGTTSIDVDGNPLALPPMEYPEYDEELPSETST